MITKTRVKIIKLRNAVIAAFFLLLPCSPPFYQPSFHLARSQINEVEEEEIVFDRCILYFVFALTCCGMQIQEPMVLLLLANAADAVDLLLLTAWIFWLLPPPTAPWLLSLQIQIQQQILMIYHFIGPISNLFLHYLCPLHCFKCQQTKIDTNQNCLTSK